MKAKKWWQRMLGSKVEITKEEVLSDTVVSEKYRSSLTEMANRLDGMLFWNKGEVAAKLIFSLLISRATEMEEVVIYSKSLSPTFYKDVLRGLRCPSRILLDDPAGVSVVRSLAQNLQERIDVRSLSSTRVDKGNVYFIATDYAFRCGEQNENDELSGWASFNDPQRTQKWRNHFEKLWANAVPIPATE